VKKPGSETLLVREIRRLLAAFVKHVRKMPKGDVWNCKPKERE